MGEGDGICMRVYIGVGGMKVWVISKTRITLRGGGGGGGGRRGLYVLEYRVE